MRFLVPTEGSHCIFTTNTRGMHTLMTASTSGDGAPAAAGVVVASASAAAVQALSREMVWICYQNRELRYLREHSVIRRAGAHNFSIVIHPLAVKYPSGFALIFSLWGSHAGIA